jgi:nicotinamide phosphoribosyltransferase
MIKLNPMYMCDFYKIGHKFQYPEGTELVYSNLTPRSDKLSTCKQSPFYDGKMIVFGIQYFIKNLHDSFEDNFFKLPLNEVLSDYKQIIEHGLGKNAITFDHIEALHKLGYLPIHIKALPEGSRVNMKVPILTICNTLSEFYWLTNFLETWMSADIWKLCTNATIAFEYKKILIHYAVKTGSDLSAVDFQAHDFSFRGMSGHMDAATSGMAHLTCFLGTDTIPAIPMLQYYYNADLHTTIGCSVPATEHSVMSLNGKDNEIELFERLITKTYPKKIVSIVSDTWDFWQVITDYLPKLKDVIMSRDGKVVIRPDSGDPVDIICGKLEETRLPSGNYEEFYPDTPEGKGAIQCLWDTFGGTINGKGYKVLDTHIGLIYGDSITLERANIILDKLEKKGFASSNVVFGIGSYTYQYSTRDSFGMAVKSTCGIVNGEKREIFKEPKTDSGTKKSARGFLNVDFIDGEYVLHDQVSFDDEIIGELITVYDSGNCNTINKTTLHKIRGQINKQLNNYMIKLKK